MLHSSSLAVVLPAACVLIFNWLTTMVLLFHWPICWQEEVRSQDAVFCIAGATSSAQGRQLSWEFLQSNWTKLSSMYEGGFLLARLVKICTENFADRNKISEIKVCSLYWPGLLRCYVKSGSFLTY